MKIKTIVHEHPDTFDQSVNEYLDKGYELTRREILTPPTAGHGPAAHYAQLTKQDEPEAPDPWDALRALKALCLSVPTEACERAECPIYDFCNKQFKELPEGWGV